MMDNSLRSTPTFVDGVLLATAAIPDAGLVFRSGACVDEQIRQTFRHHALSEALNSLIPDPRMIMTMDPYSVSLMGTEDRVVQAVEHFAGRRDISLAFLAELSRYTLVGEKLAHLAAALDARIDGCDVQAVSTRFLARDFSDALRSVNDGIAARLVAQGIGDAPTTPGTVGILGYAWNRDGGDSRGDFAELGRLVETLGLTFTGALLSARPSSTFAGVAGASTLVALPFGESAAAVVAAATGASVMSRPLPVALADTEAWLLGVAAYHGCEDRARRVIEEELTRVVPLLDRVVPRFLVGKRALVVATEEWLPSLVRCLREDLGVVVAGAVTRSRHGEPPVDGESSFDRTFDPSVDLLNHLVEGALAQGGLDLIIGSNWERNALIAAHRSIPFVEFGYPQLRSHFLQPTPHVGFNGAVTWAQRLIDAMAL